MVERGRRFKKVYAKKGGNFFIYKDLALALENMRRYQESGKIL